MDINDLVKKIALKDYNEKFEKDFSKFLWCRTYDNYLRFNIDNYQSMAEKYLKIDLYYILNNFIKYNEHKNLVLKRFLDNYIFFGILNIKEISKRSFIFFNIDEDKFQFFNVNEANAILGKFYFKIKESEL